LLEFGGQSSAAATHAGARLLEFGGQIATLLGFRGDNLYQIGRKIPMNSNNAVELLQSRVRGRGRGDDTGAKTCRPPTM